MVRRLAKEFGVVLCLLATAAAAAGDAEETEINTRARYAQSYRVEADGSFVLEREVSVVVLTEKAVESVRQTSVSYSTSVEQAEVMAAYTRKHDGRRVDSPKSNFQVETNTGKGSAGALFSDRTTLTVVFPEVAVGDTVVFSYRVTATKPMFPNHFSVAESFSRQRAYDSVRYRIDVPATLWTQYEAFGMRESLKVEKDGRRVVEWTWENPTPAKSRRIDYSVYEYGQEPGVLFSTFHDYSEIAKVYGERATPKAAVTAAVRQLADDLTKDRQTPAEIARALYEWVATNISYAGNCIGIGAVVPRDIDFTLTNHLGDCKDHATLLQALLAAKGIASTQALVNAGRTYHLPKIPVVSTVNHVINYIPSLDLYLDATADSTPYGMLPFADADKPVLLVDSYRDGMRTPRSPGLANRQLMKTVVDVQPDGSAKGRVEVSLNGMFGVASRSSLRRMSKQDEADVVKNYFQETGYIATGTFVKDDPKPLRDDHAYRAEFDVKSLLNVPGPGAFAVAPLFFSQHPVQDFLGVANQPIEEAFDIACTGGSSIEEYTYEFPKEIRLLAAPPDLKVDTELASYAATYRLEGQRLTVRRELTDRTPGNVCSPALMKDYKAFARRVLPNLRAQVVYQ